MRWMLTTVMGVGMAGALAAPAAAQVLPFDRTDGGRARTELHQAVLMEFQGVMAEWVKAVNAGDADRAAELYSEDAVVYLGGAAVGRDEVERFLRDWLVGLGSVSFGLAQFDASSSLSYALGSVTISRTGTNGTHDDDGQSVMILVLRREGRDDWRIRSQTLVEPAL